MVFHLTFADFGWGLLAGSAIIMGLYLAGYNPFEELGLARTPVNQNEAKITTLVTPADAPKLLRYDDRYWSVSNPQIKNKIGDSWITSVDLYDGSIKQEGILIANDQIDIDRSSPLHLFGSNASYYIYNKNGNTSAYAEKIKAQADEIADLKVANADLESRLEKAHGSQAMQEKDAKAKEGMNNREQFRKGFGDSGMGNPFNNIGNTTGALMSGDM